MTTINIKGARNQKVIKISLWVFIVIYVTACLYFLSIAIYSGFVGREFGSWLLVWLEIEPWVLTSTISVMLFAAAVTIAVRSRAYPIMRYSLGLFSLGLLVLSATVIGYGIRETLPIQELNNQFVVARYENNNKSRRIIFAGERHVSRLSGYTSIKSILMEADKEGYEVYYEGSDLLPLCYKEKIDIDGYGVDWWRFYLDMLRTPSFWPWFQGKRTNVDLPINEPRAKEAAHNKSDYDCFVAINKVRDDYLFERAIAQDAPKNLLIYYGSAHFEAFDRALIEHNWSRIGEPVWTSAWQPPIQGPVGNADTPTTDK